MVNIYEKTTLPDEAYKNKLATYVTLQHGMTADESKEFTDWVLKKRLFDPKVHVYHRPDGADAELEEVSFLHLLADSFSKGRVTVPSGTVYENPSVRLSNIAKQLMIWLTSRSKVKKASFIARMKGQIAKADKLFSESVILKRKANAVSGLVSAYSHLHCKSIHYTLTSTTAMATSISNGSNERYIAGNYHFREPNSAIDYMVSVLAYTDMDKVEKVLGDYNLTIINPSDLNDIIFESCQFYFSPEKYTPVYEFIHNLTPLQATVVAYTGSLYNIRLFNDEFIYEFITDIINTDEHSLDVPDDVDVLVKQMADAEEDIRVVIHHYEIEAMKAVREGYIIKGEDGKDSVINKAELQKIVNRKVVLERNMVKWGDLIDNLLHTQIMPPDPAYLPTMVRRIVVLSDTDSTCFTLEEWVDWYSNMSKGFIYPDAMGVMATIGMLAARCLTHHVTQYSQYMGMNEENDKLICMKNEFSWVLFLRAADAAKHYIAGTVGQEGNIYPSVRREVKGVGLKGVDKSPDVIKITYEIADKLMSLLMTSADNPENITTHISDVVKQYEELKKTLIDRIIKGDISILQTRMIKHPMFTSDPNPLKTDSRHVVIWNTLFGDSLFKADYNEEFVKMSLTAGNMREVEETFDRLITISSPEAIQASKELFKKMKRTSLEIFYVPKHFLLYNSFPEEISRELNVQRLLDKTLKPLQILLDTLGYYQVSYK